MNEYLHCSEPDKQYSAAAFWFLNGRLQKDKMLWQMDQMADKGVYQAFLHPRAYLETPYLEDEWWDVIGAAIEHAADTGFLSWLYDEYAWPSGVAGSTFEFCDQKPSRVLAKGKVNMARSVDVTPEPGPEDEMLFTYYMPRGCSDLTALQACPPAGDGWTPYYLVQRYWKGNVDYMNRAAIRLFLDVTHEQYKARYGDKFGKSIPGIFFDEIYMADQPLPWTEGLETRFADRFGYDLLPLMPLMMAGEGAQAAAVRRDFYTLIAELYEDAFFRQIGQWCEENHLTLTGHTEESLARHPARQGHYFRTMRHLQMPGADCHDYRYRLPRLITLHEPKYAVSVARLNSRPRAMSEAMGGAGWGCSLQEFRRGINVLGAMGINFFTLHGFYYSCEHQGSQADWPTSFFYQNPYWRYFKAFADYMRRVSYMNCIGRAAVPCGLFYPVEQMYAFTAAGQPQPEGVAMDRRFDACLETLLNHQFDTDMIDRQALLSGHGENGVFHAGEQAFRALIFSVGVEDDPDLAAAVRRARSAGVTVVFVTDGDRQALASGLEDCIRCAAEALPEQLRAAIGCDAAVVRGRGDRLYVNHRVCEQGEHFMVANGTPEARDVTLQLRAAGRVCVFSPETGRTRSVHAWDAPGGGTMVELHLEADEAVYVLFNTALEAETAPEPLLSDYRLVQGRWAFLPVGEADAALRVSTLAIPVARLATKDANRFIRICNTAWERGSIGRHVSRWHGEWITRRQGWLDNSGACDLYFRRELSLPAAPERAELCLAAVSDVEVFVNGTPAFAGHSAEEPLICDIRSCLRAGDNLIAIHVHNDHPLTATNVSESAVLPRGRMTSLLLEGRIEANGKAIPLVSDSSWAAAMEPAADWAQPGTTVHVLHEDAAKGTGFVNHLDYARTDWISAWSRGPLPLLPVGDLPLWGELPAYPMDAAYTLTLPAGTAQVYPPEIDGLTGVLLDGFPAAMDEDGLILRPDGLTHTLTLQVTARSAGDGLHAPVRVRVAEHWVNLGDWDKEGLGWYSGMARYVNTVTVRRKPGARYFLSLGDVRFNAEVYVNGKPAGVRIWAPYRLEVTDLLTDGSNEITVYVTNSAACERRYMLVDEGQALGWNRYWNVDNIEREPRNLTSGLLGEVRLYEVP